jgi:hypothetical protein
MACEFLGVGSHQKVKMTKQRHYSGLDRIHGSIRNKIILGTIYYIYKRCKHFPSPPLKSELHHN